MQLFIDSANPKEVKEMIDLGIIDGVTTNPSLATKAGIDYNEAVKQILSMVPANVSLEVLSTEAEGMIKEARSLSKLGKGVVVKLPATEEGIKALKTAKAEGIPTNVTLVFSANQALLAAKLGATMVSPFVGRLDDIGLNGTEVVEEIRQIYDNYAFETKILFASVRSPLHVKQAALIGCEIATCPYDILKSLVKHPQTDVGLNKFLDDFKKSGQKPIS
ncbi:MAG: fructose-6-phosphate aldolase [Candidatus Curtissbacteria bacterium]|nr:fructose-6-phosphate aldolase [Candidatus Curtissbacteria bacterium]